MARSDAPLTFTCGLGRGRLHSAHMALGFIYDAFTILQSMKGDLPIRRMLGIPPGILGWRDRLPCDRSAETV